MNGPVDAVVQYFLRGTLIVMPVIGSLYAVWYVLATVDGLVGGVVPLHLPGLGVVLSAVLITGVGALATNVIGGRLLRQVERWMDDLPLIRLLYASIRDMMSAFVGDQKSLDRPVIVEVGPDVHVLGFLTREAWPDASLDGLVAVYLPQTYNFAGNMILVPPERVRPVALDGTDALQIILAGGMTPAKAS